APEEFQTSNINIARETVGAWNLELLWSLELGIWSFIKARAPVVGPPQAIFSFPPANSRLHRRFDKCRATARACRRPQQSWRAPTNLRESLSLPVSFPRLPISGCRLLDC